MIALRSRRCPQQNPLDQAERGFYHSIMSADKGIRRVNFSLPDKEVPGTATARPQSTPNLRRCRRSPRRVNLISARLETSKSHSTTERARQRSTKVERQSALDNFINSMPYRASPDPIGYAVQAHNARWTHRLPWKWNYVPPGPIDSPDLFRNIFRHRIKPADLSLGINLRQQHRRALGIFDDDEDEARQVEKPDLSNQIRIPQFRLLLPSRYREPSNCCPYCDRQHISTLLYPSKECVP